MSRNIGEKIKAMRQQKELALNALAKKAGIAQSTLFLIERGEQQPRFETLQAICMALDVSLFELLSYGEDVPPTRFLREASRLPTFDFEQLLYRFYLQEDDLPGPGTPSACESES